LDPAAAPRAGPLLATLKHLNRPSDVEYNTK
jgi:hypothetical protein